MTCPCLHPANDAGPARVHAHVWTRAAFYRAPVRCRCSGGKGDPGEVREGQYVPAPFVRNIRVRAAAEFVCRTQGYAARLAATRWLDEIAAQAARHGVEREALRAHLDAHGWLPRCLKDAGVNERRNGGRDYERADLDL